MREGLSGALALPVRSGYAEAIGGISAQAGPFARFNLGIRPRENVAVYVGAEANRSDQWVLAGVKVNF